MSTLRDRPGPLVARGGNIDEADRQLRRHGLLGARQHVAAKELTVDAIVMFIDQELDIGSAHTRRRVEGGASHGAARQGTNRDGGKQAKQRPHAQSTHELAASRSAGPGAAANAASLKAKAAGRGSKH